MKESKLIEMQKKIESLGRIAELLLGEVSSLKTLSYGTHETLKLMPGYEQAIERIKEKVAEELSGLFRQITGAGAPSLAAAHRVAVYPFGETLRPPLPSVRGRGQTHLRSAPSALRRVGWHCRQALPARG